MTTTVAELTVHSQRHCYGIDPAKMQRLEQTAASRTLAPGTYMIRIQEGGFGDRAEPAVLLWIYGGRFINQDTGVAVNATWCSLNGYDDRLRLEVLEETTLAALFLDVYFGRNDTELVLSITPHAG